MSKKALSLFSSAGIGELGIKKNGIEVILSNELLEDRAKLYKENNPDNEMLVGDIWEEKDNIVNRYKNLTNENPFLIMATPPCQGMSSNGMGKLLSDHRKGLRPKLDSRNQLIIPTIEVIKKLRPEWIIFENVPNMKNTLIKKPDDSLVNIMDYIFESLSEEYIGSAEVVNTADYGVPQIRKRLITVLTRTKKGKAYFKLHGTFLPDKTHDENPNLFLEPWVTLRDSIDGLPELEAIKNKNIKSDFHPLHSVPLLDEKKYNWVINTPEGQSAFDNQCINPTCMFQGNPSHGARKVNGINQSKKDTPLYCEKCGHLLPRPYTVDKKTGNIRLMKGYISAYKRMYWDKPASTLTMNFQYVSSDNKIHPEQNRVLSIYEALVLQTIANYDYSFQMNGQIVRKGLIRDIIGESVPPLLIEKITKKILDISYETNRDEYKSIFK